MIIRAVQARDVSLTMLEWFGGGVKLDRQWPLTSDDTLFSFRLVNPFLWKHETKNRF